MDHARTIAAGLGLVMTLQAGAVGAQPPPPLPASEPQATVAPAPAPPPGRPAGTARLHLRSWRPAIIAHLYTVRADGAYSVVCQSPCKADVSPGTPLRVTLGEDDDEPHDFVMSGEPGSDIELEVRPASKGAVAGGIVMTALGGLTAFIGLVLVAAVSSSSSRSSDETRTAGWICVGVGVGLTVGGVVLIANRPREPRIKRTDHRPFRESRRDLVTADLATLGPMTPVAPAPAFMPLTFGVSF